MGVSLWLAPAESSPAYASLHELIRSLAPDPRQSFTPHVTLLTNLPPLPLSSLVSSVERAVASSSPSAPMSLPFGEVTTGTSFFQCVLVRLDRVPALQSLHEAARTALRPPNAPAVGQEMGKVLEGKDYFPHLSLMYDDLDEEAKRAVVKRLHDEGKVEGTSVVGVTAVDVDEVLVVETEGAPREWKVLARVPLM